MKQQYYIVLFKDGCMQIYSNPRVLSKDNFQQGTRFFSCNYDTKIEDISDWIARQYRLSAVIKERKFDHTGENFQKL